MPSSTKNVQLGICRVVFDGKDLGYTKGGVEVSVATETYKSEIDNFGKSAINELIQGRSVQVTVPLVETTLENLVEIMPGATLVTDGVQASATLTSGGAQPASNSTVTVAGQAFTFVSTAPTGPTQVKIGATVQESLDNLVFALTNFGWSGVPLAAAAGGLRVSRSGLIVTVKAVERGVAGNAITLVASGVPDSDLTASGANLSGGVATTRARVDVRSGTDVDMLSIAKVLRLHPKKNAETDLSQDFILWAAAPAGSLQFSYKQDAERIYNVTFSAYPDPTAGDDPRLFSIGDPHYQP